MFGVHPFGVPYFAQPTLDVAVVIGPVELEFAGAGEQVIAAGAGAGELVFDGAASGGDLITVNGALVSSVPTTGGSRR